MKTLNEQYQLIKEGKGHKSVFLKEAKQMFPNYIRNAATFDEASLILKQKGIINENIVGIAPINKIESKKESYELAFEKFLEEAKDPQIKAKEVKAKTVKSQEETEKAELKKTSKQVEEDLDKIYDPTDKKNLDNVIYGQLMRGYYAEMKDPKNEDKTMEQIRDIVLKNLAKDPIYYVKDGQFGVKGLGYETEVPGLGTPKEPTGKYKSSGYGDLNESQEDTLIVSGTTRAINMLQSELKNNNVKFTLSGNKVIVISTPKSRMAVQQVKERLGMRSIIIHKPNQSTNESTHIGKNYPGEITGKYKSSGYGDLKENLGYYMEPNPHRMDPKDIEDYSEEIEGMSKAEAIDYLLNQGLSSSMIKKVISSLNTDIRDMFNQDPDVRINTADDLYEQKLRKAIRSIINEELEEVRGGGNYGILTINPSGGGEGGRRFIPDFIPFPVNVRKRFGDHMVYNPGNGTFYISQILYNNLVKGYADQPAIKKLIMDIPMMVKQLLNKTENYGPSVNLPKEYKVYMPFVAPVEKAKSDKFNKAGTKQYWSEGDFLFPNLNKAKYSSSEEDIEESVLRNFIRESVEKELADINKEAELEVLAAKLEKIEALIQKRQSQLSKLDEDEDMKNLTDKKKVKGIEKEIKTLEKAKAKVEKMLGKSKGKKKEVIDEMGNEEPNPEFVKILNQAEEMYEGGLDMDDILIKFNFNMRGDIEKHLRMKYEGTDND